MVVRCFGDDYCHFSQTQLSQSVIQRSLRSSSGDLDQCMACHADRSVEL